MKLSVAAVMEEYGRHQLNLNFMNSFQNCALIGISLALLGGCVDIKEKAIDAMGDQDFKSMICFIELHKVRNDSFPESLDELAFIPDEVSKSIKRFRYRKLETGYELDYRDDQITKTMRSYPKEFWQGLGVVRSNLKPGS